MCFGLFDSIILVLKVSFGGMGFADARQGAVELALAIYQDPPADRAVFRGFGLRGFSVPWPQRAAMIIGQCTGRHAGVAQW